MPYAFAPHESSRAFRSEGCTGRSDPPPQPRPCPPPAPPWKCQLTQLCSFRIINPALDIGARRLGFERAGQLFFASEGKKYHHGRTESPLGCRGGAAGALSSRQRGPGSPGLSRDTLAGMRLRSSTCRSRSSTYACSAVAVPARSTCTAASAASATRHAVTPRPRARRRRQVSHHSAIVAWLAIGGLSHSSSSTIPAFDATTAGVPVPEDRKLDVVVGQEVDVSERCPDSAAGFFYLYGNFDIIYFLGLARRAPWNNPRGYHLLRHGHPLPCRIHRSHSVGTVRSGGSRSP